MSRFYLGGPYSRQRAKEAIDLAPQGYVCEVREKKRSDDQNRILHALIDDIRAQVEGAEQWSRDEWKLRFMHSLRNETRFLPELDGNGVFPVGQKTSDLSVSQFSALVDLIYEWGGRNGVRFKDIREAA
jgi:uncharacterized protein YwgA